MAATHIAFGFTDPKGIIVAGSLVGETLEPTSSSASTTVSAPSFGEARPPVARIATDTTIWAAIGPAPDVEGEDAVVLPIMADTIALFVVNPGDKVAIMTPPA
jgi:hypothetical protein